MQYNITDGTRVGDNLFHSFGEFGVPNNAIANFLNTPRDGVLPSTTNILGRVTGGEPSNIFGTLQTTGFGKVNLFLMNPFGIVFGPTASLNVGGSVTFTTADYLRLSGLGGPDAGIFHADPAQASLLSSAPVDSFGFLRTNPGSIAIQGSQLTIPEKQEIVLVGGNITIQGLLENGTIKPARLLAPNGKINMATAQSPGELFQDFSDDQNIREQLFTSIGYIQLASGSKVDVSQSGNGKVSIRGGQLILEIHDSVLSTLDNKTPTPVIPGQDTVVLAPTSQIISGTYSENAGPDIHLGANRITILGIPSARENFGRKPLTRIQSYTYGSGKAGDIDLRTTKDIELTRLAVLSSITEASGQAGNIGLTSAYGNIRMTEGGKESLGVSSVTVASGNAGNVNVSAREGDIVLDGVPVVTQSQPRPPSQQETGRPGRVEITAKNLQMSAGTLGTFTTGSAKPGNITVTLSGTLTMTADSSLNLPPGSLPDSIIVASSVSRAPSGDITITAKDIRVSQNGIINSSSFASGRGGEIKITTDILHVTDGSQISSGSTRAPNRGSLRSFVGNMTPTGDGGNITIQPLGILEGSILINGAGSGMFADTEGTGAGGSITLSTKTLAIQDGGVISASTTGTDSRATGGSIIINATDQVTLTADASVTARSTGPADAGNITINAGKQLDIERGSITTQSTELSGGNIDIRAIDLLRVVDGKISTSAINGGGNGGAITIDPKVVLLQNSDILAQANRGNGGDISITTPVFVADQSSRVDASTPFGLNGRVTIQSPTSNLSGTVGQLVSKTSPPQVLLQNRCVALAGGEQSTFLLAGRETLPVEPSGWLSSPVSMEHWTGEEALHASPLMVRNRELNSSAVMTAQRSQPPVLSLRRLTPPGFLVRTFATGVTGCPS